MISAQEEMAIIFFINRMQREYLSFMGIESLPVMRIEPFEIDMVRVCTQGIGSWAQVVYDCSSDKFTLKVWKDLYKPMLHADYLMFHEFTHAYDINRLAKGDKIKYVSIKGYIEYHASQVELLKQLNAPGYTTPPTFSMTDVIKSPGNDKTVFESLLIGKKSATDAIIKQDFPSGIDILSTVVGMIFNHLGRVSVCERYAKDYEDYKAQLEDYSIEESFFGANSWKILAGIYHGEMSQVAIDLAMKVHLGILGMLTKKYGLA